MFKEIVKLPKKSWSDCKRHFIKFPYYFLEFFRIPVKIYVKKYQAEFKLIALFVV